MVQDEKIPSSVTNWTTEQNGIFIYFGLDESIDQCLTKYKSEQQKRCVTDAIARPDGSRQQFFMHVEMALRDISIAIRLSSKGQKKNSRLDASLSAT